MQSRGARKSINPPSMTPRRLPSPHYHGYLSGLAQGEDAVAKAAAGSATDDIYRYDGMMTYIGTYINWHLFPLGVGRNYRTPPVTILTYSSRLVHIHTSDHTRTLVMGTTHLNFLKNFTNMVNGSRAYPTNSHLPCQIWWDKYISYNLNHTFASQQAMLLADYVALYW